MVSYQKWTSIAFEVAKKKGAQYDDVTDGASSVEVFAGIWNRRKAELQSATVAEARKVAQAEITIG